MQDAEAYNQRNINEEGGGGYVAFVWDCAYWGTQVKLAQLTGITSYGNEVRPCHLVHPVFCLQLSNSQVWIESRLTAACHVTHTAQQGWIAQHTKAGMLEVRFGAGSVLGEAPNARMYPGVLVDAQTPKPKTAIIAGSLLLPSLPS